MSNRSETEARATAIQLRGRLPQEERIARAKVDVTRAAALVDLNDTDSLDEADGILIAAVHAGVRPVELLLEITGQAVAVVR